MLKATFAAVLSILLAGTALAQAPAEVVFRNVRVFDGKSDRLTAATSVLVRGNQIAAMGPAAVATAPGATVIEGAEARATLMRGFTSVRDLGGPSFGLKQAIDLGVVEGPRIWPSGAMITVTSGHGDFRMQSELPRDTSRPLSRMEQIGGSMVADSPDTVRQRVREQLMRGASQIKLTAGGGVTSPRSAIDAGVKVIEHAHLVDDATARYMAEKGVWISTQPFLADEPSPFPPGPDQFLKQQQVIAGTQVIYGFVRKYRIKTAFGTDISPTSGWSRTLSATSASS